MNSNLFAKPMTQINTVARNSHLLALQRSPTLSPLICSHTNYRASSGLVLFLMRQNVPDQDDLTR